MGQVWDLVEQHMRETPYGTSGRQIATHAGLKPSTFAAWKNLKSLPSPDHLRAVARQINVPYRVLLDAALTDAGYLRTRDANSAAPNTRAGESPAAEVRKPRVDRGPVREATPSRSGSQPRLVVAPDDL